jgi:zinc transport system substrate-binding protein
LKFNRIIATIIVLTLVLAFGCAPKAESGSSPQAAPEAAEKLDIVATIFPEYDFARAITGDLANVTMLVQPGNSVHSYEPSPADMVAVQNADLFIYVGGESDEWINNILDSLEPSGMKIIRLMDHVDIVEEEIKEGMQDDEEHEHAEEEEHEGEEHEDEEEHHEEEAALDEHVWVSPKNAVSFVEVILGAVTELDPANTDFYAGNAKMYRDELKEIDGEITNLVNSAARKKIVVADRFPFRYFVDAYGLDYEAAFPGCVDQADAAPQTIAHLVSSVEEADLPYIYHIELSNQNVASAVAEQTGAQMLQLNSCHNLSKTDFDAGITYAQLMRQNIDALDKGLNG